MNRFDCLEEMARKFETSCFGYGTQFSFFNEGPNQPFNAALSYSFSRTDPQQPLSEFETLSNFNTTDCQLESTPIAIHESIFSSGYSLRTESSFASKEELTNFFIINDLPFMDQRSSLEAELLAEKNKDMVTTSENAGPLSSSILFISDEPFDSCDSELAFWDAMLHKLTQSWIQQSLKSQESSMLEAHFWNAIE